MLPSRAAATVAALCLACAAHAQSSGGGGGGYLALAHAAAIEGGGTVLMRAEAGLHGQTAFGACQARFDVRIRHDEALSTPPGTEGELREAAVLCRLDRWLLQAGRQSVVWGKADGLAVLDAVHPFDRREFPFADREQARLALTILRAEVRVTDNDTVQGLWIPERREELLPAPGGRFAAGWGAQAALANTAAAASGRWRQPQWGGQWEHGDPGLSWTLNALQRWAPQPGWDVDLSTGRVQRRAYRQTIIGGSFEFEAGAGWVLRGEGATTDRQALPAVPGAGVPRFSRQRSTIVGADHLWDDTLLAAQWMRTAWRGPLPEGTRPAQDWLTLAASRSAWQDRLHLKASSAWDLTRRARWLRAEARLQRSATWSAAFTVDAVRGRPDSVLGAFQPASRMGLSVRADW